MFLIVGLIIVFGCVFGGYILAGGKMDIIIKAAPVELLIIFGSATGAFIVANPGKVLKKALGGLGVAAKGPSKKKEDYAELLSLIYLILKTVKGKGVLAIEGHVENPDDSELFKQFDKVYKDKYAIEFITDYLRLWTLGTENAAQIDGMMKADIETFHYEKNQIANAYAVMADGLPALGIVAAVLGIIKTMGSITEPPEVLGKMIGAALVGTFLGVFLSYGVVGPISGIIGTTAKAEAKFYECIRAAMIAHLNGYAPQVSIEFARKTLTSDVRPTFYELEEMVNELPPI